MKQTHRASMTESLLNILLGYSIQVGALYVIALVMGLAVSGTQSIIVGIPMTVISFIRSYALRRLFEELRVKGLLP